MQVPAHSSLDSSTILLNPARLVRWVYVGRLSIAAAIFVAALYTWQSDRIGGTGELLVASLILVVTLLVTSVSAFFSRFGGHARRQTFYYLQSVFDLLLVTAVVHITLDSNPRGAQIFRAGVAGSLGVTPFRLELKENDPEFDVQLKLEGYRDETKMITTARDHDVLVALAKVEAPAPVAVVTPTPTPTPNGADPKRDHGKKTGGHGGGKKGGDKDDVMEPVF